MMTSVGSNKKTKLLVAAKDFGTTYSSYAFSFKHEFKKDPAMVSVNQNWVAGSMTLVSVKVSTVVLFDKKKEFHSFGYEAENNYSELALDNEHQQWYFFKKFKMRLHENESHLLETLKKRGTLVDVKDIHWVRTVPAIWVDSAKQFMRECANKGIDGSLLSIALEPEAASLYCQHLPTNRILLADKVYGTDGATFTVSSPGSKYMVIDLGGGTADITVHEHQTDGRLKEIHKVSGGAWGGTKVDDEFNQLLIKIIGVPAFSKFCAEKTADYLSLQRELEIKKWVTMLTTTRKVTLKIPVSLAEIYKKEKRLYK